MKMSFLCNINYLLPFTNRKKYKHQIIDAVTLTDVKITSKIEKQNLALTSSVCLNANATS